MLLESTKKILANNSLLMVLFLFESEDYKSGASKWMNVA
jgi:hypothetical protein